MTTPLLEQLSHIAEELGLPYAVGLYAVSYTHLTLPTILLV